MNNGRIAVPSMDATGLDSQRSGHFGHCPCFTLIDVVDGQITEVSIVDNVAHREGGCLVPVNLLAGHKVTALVVSGIGMRPLVGFNDVGITVYYEAQTPGVKDVVELLLADKLPEMQPQNACGGH